MKNIAIVLFIISNFGAFAQNRNNQNPEKSRERIESLRIAFITERLNLSSKESQQFWPVYNSFKDESNQIRMSSRPDAAIEDMSEKEAEEFIMDRFSQQERQLNLEKKYYAKFREVISVRKIAMLYEAENEFKKKLLNAVRNRQEQGFRKRPLR